jgi:hypothetical protein
VEPHRDAEKAEASHGSRSAAVVVLRMR